MIETAVGPGPVRECPSQLGRSAAQIFAALDVGATELEQTLGVLRVLNPTVVPEELTVGELDRAVLSAYRSMTGRDVDVTTRCESCGQCNTFTFAAATESPHVPMSAWAGPGEGLRQPCCRDLLALPDEPESAAQELARRCAVGPRSGPRDIDGFERIDTTLTGSAYGPCVECGATVSADVDVAHRAIVEIAALRADFDREVDALAARYGWTPAVIDDLPDGRRHRLAELARAAL